MKKTVLESILNQMHFICHTVCYRGHSFNQAKECNANIFYTQFIVTAIIIGHNELIQEWKILRLMTLIPEHHKTYRTYSMN